MNKKETEASLLARKIAHDLNSPLTAFRLLVDLLGDDSYVNKKFTSALQLGRDAADRLEKKIHEIRTMDIRIEEAPVEIHALIEGVLSSYSESAHRLKIKVERSYSSEPVYIKEDAAKVRQWVNDRLIQLLKSENKNQIIDVAVVTETKEFERCGIKLQLSNHVLPLIEFKRFALPLPVEAYSGFVSEVVIPIGANVIVFEDSELIQRFWKNKFEKEGQSIRIYSRWEDFNISLDENSTSVFIVDINFENSQYSGFDIIEQVRLRSQNAVIYVCSGDLWDSQVREKLSVHGVQFISKPVPPHIRLTFVGVESPTTTGQIT